LHSRIAPNGCYGPDGCPGQLIRENIRSQDIQAFAGAQQLQLPDEKGLDQWVFRFLKGFGVMMCHLRADFFIHTGAGYVLNHAVQGIFGLGQGRSVAPEFLGKHQDTFFAC